MKIYLVETLYLFDFYIGTFVKGLFYNKHSSYIVGNTHSPYKAHFNSQSGLTCLAHCNRESICLTANYNEQTKTCSLYDCKIDANYLVPKFSSDVFTIKSSHTTNSLNYSEPSIIVNSINGTAMTKVLGIIEIKNDTSYSIISDRDNNRVLKLNDNGEFIKSTTVDNPRFITKSQKYIYVNSDWTSIIRLNFDLDQNSTIITDNSIEGIHYDLSKNNIYISSWVNKSIYIYNTNDNETTFTKISTISTSNRLRSITIYNDKIYTGIENGTILVYIKSNYSLIQVMNNMCPNTNIRSFKFDCNDNMIYSCENPPMVKIIAANGLNTTLSLSGTFTYAYETYIDSKNRLWIGGNNGFIVYN